MLAQDESSACARRGARELLVKALYQWQLAGQSEREIKSQFSSLPEFDRIDKLYFSDLLIIVLNNVKCLDQKIEEHSSRDVRLLDAVSRSVLLLSAAELTQRVDIPRKVVINEAVELAKRYGPKDCFKFINGVLDKLSVNVLDGE